MRSDGVLEFEIVQQEPGDVCRTAERPTRWPEVLAVVEYSHDWRESLLPGVLVCGACGRFRRMDDNERH